MNPRPLNENEYEYNNNNNKENKYNKRPKIYRFYSIKLYLLNRLILTNLNINTNLFLKLFLFILSIYLIKMSYKYMSYLSNLIKEEIDFKILNDKNRYALKAMPLASEIFTTPKGVWFCLCNGFNRIKYCFRNSTTHASKSR